MASFLYCFPYSYPSFTLLKVLAKSNSNLIAIAFKSEKSDNKAIKKKSKELIAKRMQKGLRVITLQVAIHIEKSNIAIAILEK